MPTQRYERIPDAERGEHAGTPQAASPPHSQPIPNSPPPSFRSRASSPQDSATLRRSATSDVDATLEDTFNVHSDDDDENEDERNGGDARQRLMHASSADAGQHDYGAPPTPPPASGGRGVNLTSFSSSNDGVFANLNAKPERGEKLEEQPPSYEQAAADATPPYWETTILAPGMASDEVFIDGLPVGSVFSFAWNGIISMTFQLVGFLLTYLLHTTHAAKNGSRAGLGVTLISWGFQMKTSIERRQSPGGGPGNDGYATPQQPNSHDFDPSQLAESMSDAVGRVAGRAATAVFARTAGGGGAGETPEEYDNGLMASWLAYVVMIVGWMILIKAMMDFVRARRHEQLILQSPDRGLGMPVVGDGEPLESVV